MMLSDLMERGEEASAQYWPSSGICQYGEYTVELMGEEPLEGFIIRDLSVMDARVHTYICKFDDHYHIYLVTDSESKPCDTVAHNQLEGQWSLLQPEEYH